MEKYAREELTEALGIVSSSISKCEKAQRVDFSITAPIYGVDQ